MEGKNFYRSIGSVSCSEFGGEKVVFNRIGFRHLIAKGGIRRSPKDRYRRFALLPNAVEIIREAGKIISHNEKIVMRMVHRGKKRISIPSSATFWTLAAPFGKRTILVVIRQFAEGKKHFLSVYDKKTKKLPD